MDPFSVTSGTIGVISVAIIVCDGLLSYVNSYRSRQKELRPLTQRTEWLKSMLQSLQERQLDHNATQEALQASIRQRVDACDARLQDINAFNDIYLWDESPSILRDSMAVTRKPKYPFQRGKVKAFERHLQDIYCVLSSQVVLMNL